MNAAVRQNAREAWSLLLIDEAPGRVLASPILTSRACLCAGYAVGEYCRDAGAMAKSHLKALEVFGHDGICLFSDVGILAEAMGSVFHHAEHAVPILDRPLVGEADDPRELRAPGPRSGRLPVIVGAARTCHASAGDVVPVFAFVPGPFTTAAMLAGVEAFLTALVLDPPRARALLDAGARASVPFLDALMVAGALPVIVEPLASASVVSPKTFEDFARPYILRLVRYLHRFDLDVVLHVCGETGPEFGLLPGTEADLLSLDKVDLAEASARPGRRCRIVGNLSTDLMLRGAPGEVGRAVEAMIEVGRGTPKGYVASTGCELPAATPDENIHAFIEAARDAASPPETEKKS